MDSGGTMTLAFELDALEALADPNAVFDDARQWTEYVGVLSDQPTYVVTNFTRKRRIRQDFFSGPRGVRESLDNVADQFETDRHVFVGTTDEHRAAAGSISPPRRPRSLPGGSWANTTPRTPSRPRRGTTGRSPAVAVRA
jgi:hypothetical protein